MLWGNPFISIHQTDILPFDPLQFPSRSIDIDPLILISKAKTKNKSDFCIKMSIKTKEMQDVSPKHGAISLQTVLRVIVPVVPC